MIRYRSGYKYQLQDSYSCRIAITGHNIKTAYIDLDPSGWLTIRSGYAWDGPSGPTIDTPNFMRGSLVHDALAQLIREGFLPIENLDKINRELQRICVEDGMSWIRSQWVYYGVAIAGKSFCVGDGGKPLCTAP